MLREDITGDRQLSLAPTISPSVDIFIVPRDAFQPAFRGARGVYYTYVLRSARDEEFYTGCTGDLRFRFMQHNDGSVPAFSQRAK